MSEPILLVRGVEAGYRAKQILFGADFDVMQGEVIALLGANGSGKSTLMNAIRGFVRSSRGSITLGGRELVGLPPHRRLRCGVVRSEERRVGKGVSVRVALGGRRIIKKKNNTT